MAQRVAADGALGPVLVPSEDLGGIGVDKHVVSALSNGGALVVWIHNSALGRLSRWVVASRYRNGAFEPVEIIADNNVGSDAQVAPLPGGRGLVAWTELTPGPSGPAVVLQ